MENNSNFEPLFNINWIGLIQVNIDEIGNHHIF